MLIVGFWMAMTGLLIVRELYPESSRLNSIPLSYVGQLIFQHGLASDLQIYDAGKEVGYVHMQPKVHPDRSRTIDFQGNIVLSPIGMSKQRLTWHGNLSLTEKNEVLRFGTRISTQEPANSLDIEIDARLKTARYQVRINSQLVDQSTISLDRFGLGKLLERVGIDTSILQQLQTSRPEQVAVAGSGAEFNSYQSSVRLNGETVSTYLVSLKVSGQTFLEVHFSQLGQALFAQAPLFGYRMLPYNVRP